MSGFLSNFRRLAAVAGPMYRGAVVGHVWSPRSLASPLSTTYQRLCSSSTTVAEKADTKTVQLTFLNRQGMRLAVDATVGDNLLDVVIDNDIDIEGYGACEGTLACSTCHVVLDAYTYSNTPEPTTEELDMLDLAAGITDTSRLGCQVEVTPKMAGIVIKVPDEVSDARQ